LAEIKSIASIGIADVAGMGLVAIFWFYMATELDTAEYGEIHYFLGIAGLAYAISLIGTQNTLIVSTAKKIKTVSTLSFITFIVASISATIVILIFYRFDVMLIIFGLIISELSIGYLLGKKIYKDYSKYVLTQKILMVTLGSGFYFLLGIEGILYGLALSYFHYIIIFYKIFSKSKISFSNLKPHSGFIRDNYLYSLSIGFRGHLGNLIIVPLFGFAVLGNYALSLQFIVVLMMFSNIIYKYLLGQEASNIQHEGLKKVAILVSIGISVLGITLLPLAVTSVFPKYIDSIDAIRIMSLAILPSTITILYTSKLLSMEKSKAVLIGKVISVLTMIAGIVVLGKFFDLIGIAIAFVSASTIEAIYLTSYSKFKSVVNNE
jgi:O-antigen/teichoic acid export membrane protein